MSVGSSPLHDRLLVTLAVIVNFAAQVFEELSSRIAGLW